MSRRFKLALTWLKMAVRERPALLAKAVQPGREKDKRTSRFKVALSDAPGELPCFL